MCLAGSFSKWGDQYSVHICFWIHLPSPALPHRELNLLDSLVLLQSKVLIEDWRMKKEVSALPLACGIFRSGWSPPWCQLLLHSTLRGSSSPQDGSGFWVLEITASSLCSPSSRGATFCCNWKSLVCLTISCSTFRPSVTRYPWIKCFHLRDLQWFLFFWLYSVQVNWL